MNVTLGGITKDISVADCKDISVADCKSWLDVMNKMLAGTAMTGHAPSDYQCEATLEVGDMGYFSLDCDLLSGHAEEWHYDESLGVRWIPDE